MKISFPVSLLAVTGVASAAEPAVMDRLMSLKLSQREEYQSQGFFEPGKYNGNNRYHKCHNGHAGEYRCDNVDMHGFLSHEEMGSSTREGNDIWGWTSPNGREFGAVGQTDGTAFVEIKENGRLEYKGRLPTQTYPIAWRDMKVIDGYVYIGSEAEGHGLQVFDMRKLLRVRKPREFSIHEDLTAWYDGFGSSHNIVSHEETNMIYAVGTQRNLSCHGGLWMVDVSNPANPTSPGCASEDGYVHDAQCVIYVGPDSKYLHREICFNYNEDTLTIVDVTDKKTPVIISKTPYVGAAYTHQGWVTNDKWMTHLLLDDELDEDEGTGPAGNGHTTTYVFDITSLEKPVNTGHYQSPEKSIDHNQYVIDGLTYQANYASGLRIVDISSYWRHPDGSKFEQVGFFDCHPEDDDVGGLVKFIGTWSVYPYFKSGYILLNSIERGVYSLKYDHGD